MNINILVFEDSRKVRESIALLLATDSELSVTGMFSNTRNCVQEALYAKPDVVLMDINMPGTNGLEDVRKLKKEMPNLQVIIQTIADDILHIHKAILAGASGYLLKNDLSKSLITAIKESNAGGSPMSPLIARKVLGIVQQNSMNKPKPMMEYGLTRREIEVLCCIVNGLSYKMVASKLMITYETVRSHMKSIYVKLHVASLTEVVAKAINENIV